MASGGLPSPDGVDIRPYRAADHNACRRLWGELVEHRGELYAAAERNPGDVGAGFEEYLTRLDLSGLWVADTRPRGQSVQAQSDGVVGFVGLTLDGSTGCIDPVVVTRGQRGRGIGRALLATVATEARRRSLIQLTVSPSARDQAALRSLHAAGFGSVSSLTLSYALRRPDGTRRGQSDEPDAALDLYDLRFQR
jgi:GNAT superfamily N-acetyltransferase